MLMELLDLLLGDLDLLQGRGDLLEGQEPTVLAVDDELAKIVQLPDRCLISEKYVCLGTHAPSFPRQ
jgi:hypothetical protein